MGTLLPIISLLIVVILGFLITRVAAVALMFTGLSHDLARFQARSAYLGVGFTTSEAEEVLKHPVRRRIIMWLMLLGNAGIVATISTIIPLFVTSEEKPSSFLPRLLILASGLVFLWIFANSKWVDRQMSRLIASALKRWTNLEVRDYQGLLQLSSGYTVSEMKVTAGDWLAGKNLAQLRLGDEGVQILGIRRADGEYIGAPTGNTYLRKGDLLILYGQGKHLAELEFRRADASGDAAHERRVVEQQTMFATQADLRDDPRNAPPKP